MGLSREEIEEVKRQHLQQLEQLEAARAHKRASQDPAESNVSPEDEQEAREREQERIRNEVSEQFYRKKGFKRYVDHRGRVLWLPPEEYAQRIEKRRRNRAKTGGDPIFMAKVQQTVIYVLVALTALVAGFFLAR